MEYRYQGLDQGSKVRYLLNGIRCDTLSTAVAAVRVHSDKYENYFDPVVTFLTHYINKRSTTPSLKVSSVMQTRPTNWQMINAGHCTFKGKIELKKNSQEEYDSLIMAQHQQLHEFWKKDGFIKGKMTPESSRASEAKVAMLEAKTDNSRDESLFPDEKPKASNRNNSALDRKGNGTRQSHADT